MRFLLYCCCVLPAGFHTPPPPPTPASPQVPFQLPKQQDGCTRLSQPGARRTQKTPRPLHTATAQEMTQEAGVTPSLGTTLKPLRLLDTTVSTIMMVSRGAAKPTCCCFQSTSVTAHPSSLVKSCKPYVCVSGVCCTCQFLLLLARPATVEAGDKITH
jgi:hypothetical protein